MFQHIARTCFAGIIWIAVIANSGNSMAQQPVADSIESSIDSFAIDEIDSLVQQGIRDGQLPGCVISASRHGKVFYQNAFGMRQVEPEQVEMTVDTVFDMASITKPVVTATCTMKLIESGRLGVEDRVTKFFPEFAVNGKDQITVGQLLSHQSGLIPDNALSDYADGPEIAWRKICQLHLRWPVGSVFKYSDVNFIVLGKIVEDICGKSLHEYSREMIFQPLGMRETGFLPSPELRQRAAPTERRDGAWMRGVVHDPRAFRLGGIAGHAGLFSTASDMISYGEMMLGSGTHRESQVRALAPETVALMTKDVPVATGTNTHAIRTLGWDRQTAYSSNRGTRLSEDAFGHGGFTGTVLWIDPQIDLTFVFLSNRLHPDGKGSVNRLAGQILDVLVEAIPEADRPDE